MICIWSSGCYCHPIISCLIKIQIDLTFPVPAYPGCPGKEVVKRVSVCLEVLNDCIQRNNREVIIVFQRMDECHHRHGKVLLAAFFTSFRLSVSAVNFSAVSVS